MFFFEQTFQTVLNGIDGAGGPMGAITNIANAILLLCALFAVYEAYARGGDARMIGVAAAKFLILGLIVSNYSTIFRNVNGAFNQVAATISPNDWANNWMLQVNQYFNGLGNANWFNLVVSSIVALVSVLVQLIAAIIFPISLLILRLPPSRLARSRMPRMPRPGLLKPPIIPRPSSRTLAVSRRSVAVSSIQIVDGAP